MKTVGVRELKNRLSEYLRQVRSGEELAVTDRGEIIAELTPPGQTSRDATIPAGVAALARRGLLTLATSPGAARYAALPRTHRRHAAARLLDDERGAR